MIIQHLQTAEFLENRNKKTTTKLQKTLEKLSSGYKVNRAADDAASLAVSEKMRGILAGLNQGVNNINDGISYLHTVDGSCQEIDHILNRLKELAVQAANGTYDDDVDRQAIDEEYQQLVDEIGYITDTADFNGIPLFEQHYSSYELNKGLVVHNYPITIDKDNDTLEVGYTINGESKEISVKIPHGTYTAEEIADMIDSDLFVPAHNLIIGVNEENKFTLQTEPGKLDYLGGSAASLFYDCTIGASDGFLLGVTVFQKDTSKMEIVSGQNDEISFRVGDSDTIYSITLDSGWYTRDKLIEAMNSKFTASGIPGDVKAVPATNSEGGKIIGLSSKQTITGLTGNFLKMDRYSSPIYDICNYGQIDNTQSVFTGRRVIPNNLEIIRGRNDYFVLDIGYYGDDGSAKTERVTVNLLDDNQDVKTYAAPQQLTDRIQAQLGDAPIKVEIGPSGNILMTSEQYGNKCKIDLVESLAPSAYMVYDLFDSGTLSRISDPAASRFTPASFSAKRDVSGEIEITDGVNELKFDLTTDSGNRSITVTVPAGTYSSGGSQLSAALNQALQNSYPDLADKLEFNVGPTISLSATKYDGADISAITCSTSSSAYSKLIKGTYLADSLSVENGSETQYASSSGTNPSTGAPAVSSAQGTTTNVVTYSNDVTSSALATDTYAKYYSAGISSVAGKTTSTGEHESIVGDTSIIETPATITFSNVMTEFSAGGTSLRDRVFSVTISDNGDEKRIDATIPKGKTADQALDIIKKALGNYATAEKSNDNSLKITTKAKGDNVLIYTNDEHDLKYRETVSSLASNPNAVVNRETNEVYVPASMKIPHADTELPLVVDETSDRFVINGGSKTYDLTLEHKTYTTLSQIAAELNAKIAEADGGSPKLTVSVGTDGKALDFKAADKSLNNITVGGATSTNLAKTKHVKSTAGNPYYDAPSGTIKEPASMRVESFDSHFPMTVTAANKHITMDYTSPDGTETIGFDIPEGTYTSAAQAAQKIGEVIAADPDLSSKIKVSYSASGANKGITFTTVNGGAGYNLSNISSDAELEKFVVKKTPSSGGVVDEGANVIRYPATMTNGSFSSLFDGDGIEINAENKHCCILVNGSPVSFDVPEGVYKGASGRDAMIGYLQTALSGNGATAKYENGSLIITTTEGGNGKKLSVGDSNTSVYFKRAAAVAAPQTVTRTDSRCSLIGQNKITSVTVSDYNNKMSFDYTVDGHSGKVDVEIPAGTYTAAQLVQKMQESIDGKIGADELKVYITNGGAIGIIGAGPSDNRSIKNFSGRLYDNVFQSAKYTSVSVHTEKPGTTAGSSVSYIVGRNDLSPKNADEYLSGKNVTIYTGLNDNVIFDLHYGNDTIKVDFNIPSGSYTRKQLADAVEKAGRAAMAGLTDSNGDPFPADFFNATIGLSEIGGVENHTGISSSDKLVFWCKLPNDGSKAHQNAIIDGVRGSSAYRIFYDATKSPQPSVMIGNPDLSEGIVINNDNNVLEFDLDDDTITLDIPNGTYTLEGLEDKLNEMLEGMNSLVRVSSRSGRLMFYTIENGAFHFNKFRGSASDDLIYGSEGRETDDDIGIHTGRRTGSYIMYAKTRVDEHLMRINTTGVTTAERASKAIDRLDFANRYLLTYRALSGAEENRSEHTLSKNQIYIQNLTAADSQLRDANMAEEMAELTKQQILMDAQHSLFGHVNQHASSVINLLG